MLKNLKLSLIQFDIRWMDVDSNLLYLESLLLSEKSKSDLIVLPEMFTSGFTMENKKKIASKATYTIDWMKSQSKFLDSAILASLIVCDNKKYYNRLVCVKDDEIIAQYDKRHLFRMGNEHMHFSVGCNKSIFNLEGWRINPLICYDLRFPVWSRNQNNYDLLIYIANWPSSRQKVWDILLKARAIENQSYVIGVNRIGTDGMNLNYIGNSMLIDAKGESIIIAELNQEQILRYELNASSLEQFRMKFPAHLDADSFEILNL